ESAEEYDDYNPSTEKEGPSATASTMSTPTAAAAGTPTTASSSSPTRRTSHAFSPSSSPSPPSSPAHGAVSIPPPSSALAIQTSSIAPASVRLSTTPLFPSPLAQASGPAEAEDTEQSKGEDGDGESEDDERGDGLWGKGRGSPLQRVSSNTAPFGELDLSPTFSTIGLPDVNALGLEPNRTPRPPPRSGGGHQRTLSGRDSSPEVDVGRTARAMRVRSVGRASGLASAAARASEDANMARRRSRTAEVTSLGSTSSATSSSGSSFGYPGPPPVSSSRAVPPLLTGFNVSTPPASPSSVPPASTISRRASINLASPPRSFAPSSPSASRAPRSSLSAALAAPIPGPFPAPPPPSDAIKLNKVPEAVRSAMDIRQPASASLGFLGESMSLPGPGFTPGFSMGSPSDIKVPKTPSATRAPSPNSGSGSASDTVRTQPNSQSSSRGPSRGPSRRGSAERLLAPPLASSHHFATPSLGSSSAFSPLFPFPSGPSGGAARRDRSKSVYLPPTATFPDSPTEATPSGSVPATTSTSSGFLAAPDPFTAPRPVGARSSRLSTHRTSVVPAEASAMSTSAENTNEYAQIIMASRSAKMRKWKTSGSSVGSLGLDPKRLTSDHWARRPIPAFGGGGGVGGEEEGVLEEADITDSEAADFGLGGPIKEVEWVDWLDEYRKMKEAKLLAEQQERIARGEEAVQEVGEPESEVEGEKKRKSELKGKQKESSAVDNEFNPFEATTAHINRQTTGFLTPNPPVQYFPLHASVPSPGFQPRTTANPAFEFEGSSVGSPSSVATSSLSPGGKRKKNFKLGTKIDAWWSAVRTSFSAGSEEEKNAERDRNRRTSDTPPISSSLQPIVSRTSNQFARPTTPGTPALRNVASAQDLGSRVQTPANESAPPVPTGALAPIARLGPTLKPPLTSGGSGGSDPDSDTATAKDSRWRNPHLSLNLGPSFNSLITPKDRSRKAAADSSNSGSDVTPFSPTEAPPSHSTAPTSQPLASGLPMTSAALTPGDAMLWDQTPGLVPTSSVFPTRGIKAGKDVRPEAIKDAKAGLNANFSMHSVRQQIRLRLASAKDNCDKALKKLVQGITAHVELELHKQIQGPFGGFEEGQFGELVGDDGYASVDVDSESEAVVDVDAGYDTQNTDSDSGPAQSMQSLPQAEAGGHTDLMVVLQDIITVATEILDTPISKLTARPGSCAEYIERVQVIGKAWEDDPELPLRGWYVQLLLAVAGLSRVVEWWEAERGFWTFEDADDEDAEPILFIAKPTTEEDLRGSGGQGGSPATSSTSPTQPAKYSPLGIDLGGGDESAGEPAEATEDSHAVTAGDAEDLRQAVETVTSQTLLMELSLNGQLFQYLSSAWLDLVGLDPMDCLDHPISDFLYPDDAAVFAEATRQLEADDSHTVEVSFRLRVGTSSASSEASDEEPEDLYEVMEGKGMLMLDGVIGGPSHTMWVIRPAPYLPTSPGPTTEDASNRFGLQGLHRRTTSDPSVPFGPFTKMASESILCRICERPTPAWFFEKHNETCNETHRLESDISECNERLRDLSHTVEDLIAVLQEPEPAEEPEYRGIALLSPPDVPTPPSYLEGLRPPLSTRPQAMQIRKAQNKVLDAVSDIIHTAIAISTPSVTDESGDIPIQDQRLLSPNSENKLALVMRWQRPTSEDAALIRLIADTEEQTRFKLNTVNRLRNTILYAEKVRQEWEAKAAEFFAQHEAEKEATRPFDSPQLQPLPSFDSPKHLEPLDLSNRALDRKPSSNFGGFGLMSPHLAPETPGMSTSPSIANLLSPRIPSGVPSSRTKASSIKDFQIIKPISKGAFGSVYLAKKNTTGDYYAIKVLKKSDMIAKNQVTNVKAERMILMTQTESDFVVKLYYTFQSKDYLYLVMEYLNGGDCAALVKNMGELPEEWARKYIAEVVVGLEYLHASGIVHRDLKPDNLLIDVKGHLKLTDFGLSRIGLLGRQTRMPLPQARRGSRDTSAVRSQSKDTHASNTSSPSMTPANAIGASQASYFGSLTNDSFWLDTPNSESSGSGSLAISQKGPFDKLPSAAGAPSALEPPPATGQRQFVGTPDYLAPESILGIGMDARVDWWALGVICYEFLYGIPPFHDETPEKVFENILSRRIEWHEDIIEISPDARDFMERLLCSDTSRRLGANGAQEVKAHPFLASVDWENLLSGEVDFVPKIDNPESTEYFDDRGASGQVFSDDDDHEQHDAIMEDLKSIETAAPSPQPYKRAPRERSETEPSPHEDFGTFNFRNLPVLKQANDDVIRQMRDQQLLPPLAMAPPDSPITAARPIPLAAKSRPGSIDFRASLGGPSSPSSHSTSSSSSNPSRATAPSTPYSLGTNHSRRPSEQHPVERLRPRQSSVNVGTSGGGQHSRRNSLPSRLRRQSISEPFDRPPIPEGWNTRRRASGQTPPSSQLSSPAESIQPLPPVLPIPERLALKETHSLPSAAPSLSSSTSAPRTNTIDCLIAGRNPISNKVLETILVRLGCRCVVVANGAEAILAAGGVKFDIIWMDVFMDIVDGEKAARMIKSTNNPSSSCPIIAVCSSPMGLDDEVGTLFSGTLPKPINREEVLAVFRQKLNFSIEQ
ncbi:serine/threonine protein kinase RIM15, partial [Pseudohyphozyma bogoriensis]